MSSLILVLLIPTICFAGDFDKTDRNLMGTVCVLQLADGMTTMHLQNEGVYIADKWNWKYGTESPSSLHMWSIKGAELVGCYYVAKWLPSKYRKAFLFGVSTVLMSCVHGNLGISAGFSF